MEDNNLSKGMVCVSRDYVEISGRKILVYKFNDEVAVPLSQFRKPRQSVTSDENKKKQLRTYIEQKVEKFLNKNYFDMTEDEMNDFAKSILHNLPNRSQERIVEKADNNSFKITFPVTSPCADETPQNHKNFSNQKHRPVYKQSYEGMNNKVPYQSNGAQYSHNRKENGQNSFENKQSNDFSSNNLRRPNTTNFNKSREGTGDYRTNNRSNQFNHGSQIDTIQNTSRGSLPLNESRKPRNETYRSQPACSTPKNTNLETRSPEIASSASPFVETLQNSLTKSHQNSLIESPKNSLLKSPQNSLIKSPPNPLTKYLQQSQVTASNRGLSLDKLSKTSGLIEFKTVVPKGLIAFIFPDQLEDEVNLLEEISNECKFDPNFKPRTGELVAIKHDEQYVRATIISCAKNLYTCALIDYGVVKTSTEVRRLPEKFVNVSEFACFFEVSPEIAKDVEINMPQNCHSDEPSMVIFNGISKTRYEIKGSRWNPFETSPPTSEIISEEKAQIFYEKDMPKSSVKKDDFVIIAGEQEGRLLVRTRDCNSLLKQVNQELTVYEAQVLKAKPEIGQLAVCSYVDNKFYRVVITDVSKAATVEYLDYGNFETVAVEKLLIINEKLANLGNTLIKITLQGFSKEKFTDPMLSFLADCSERKEKFCVVSSNVDEYDLESADKSRLSNKLKQFNKPPVVYLGDLPKVKLNTGLNEVLCMCTDCIDDGQITVCAIQESSATETLKILMKKAEEYAKKDDTPYHPELFEVCLAKFDGEWFRASCMKISGENYTLFYVEYGNLNVATANDIRKLPEELATITCFSVCCILSDVMDDKDNVIKSQAAKIKSYVKDQEMCTIDVVKCDHGVYRITIPGFIKDQE